MNEEKMKKIWLFLYLIVAAIFPIIGLAMIFLDRQILNGIQYLATSMLFAVAIFLIKKDRISPDYSNPILNLGFVFLIAGLTSPIGLNLYTGMWSLGIIFFLSGLFKK